MNGTAAVIAVLGSTKFLMENYLSDLTNEDILVRATPGANHIAWQMGHLISSEIHMVKEQIPDASYPELPEGFAEKHGMDCTGKDEPSGFCSTEEYKNLFAQVRAATIENVGKLSDEDLDKPTTGKMADFCPKLGDILVLVSNHSLMHGGQFSVLRRKLEKPVLF